MPNFQYKAKNRTGELITGMVAAGDRRLALAELGRLGYFPLAVAAAAEKETTRKSGWRRSATRRDCPAATSLGRTRALYRVRPR
jgi:type II secretory pathway component PulF